MGSFRRFRSAVAFAFSAAILGPATLLGQVVRAGVEPQPVGTPMPTNGLVYTTLDFNRPFQLDGQLSEVSFAWSTGPCPGGIKVKVFRPSPPPLAAEGSPPAPLYRFVAQAGPFSVPVIDPSPILPGPPFPILMFTIDPAISVERGDVLGITNVTACGGPMRVGPPPPTVPSPLSFSVPGDVRSDILDVSHSPVNLGVMLLGIGPSPALGLLYDRFAVTVSARDPRTGQTTEGAPFKIANGSGFFALPGFTGDPLVPELTVKMVDGTGSATLGGTFWFFYAPLTDAELMITVKDQSNGAVRTYQSSSPEGTQLCGAADTSAFPP
jgi:hypothetical protein